MRKFAVLITLLIPLLAAHPSLAVKIADIARIDGERTNSLTGIGLVTGLKGTGDGGDFAPAMKALAQLFTAFDTPTQLTDLTKAQNVAIVMLNATIPAGGARDGDHIDIHVSSIGAATSLKYGQLLICELAATGSRDKKGKMSKMVFGHAEGPVEVEDPASPNVGVIRGGGTMEANFVTQPVTDGRFKLIIQDPSASWTNANTIATIINDLSDSKEDTLATAVDSKNVIVTIPPSELKHPDAFISRVLQLPVLLLPTEARVLINDRTGTMIITGDVEISPVVITHKGLTISTIDPKPTPRPQAPVTTVKDFAALDTTQQGGAKLEDLGTALDQLKVPAEDRIEIVKELYRIGKLHAKLIYNGVEL